MDWQLAPDIKIRLDKLLSRGLFPHIPLSQVTAMRGFGSTSRAIARIWSLPRPWQQALKVAPQYIIEVITQHFDKLDDSQKDKTLIHELMHIPKTFSGSLVSHRGRYHRINHQTVGKLYDDFITRRK